MIITGVPIGTSSLTRVHTISSTVLFVTLLVQYATGKDCTCESNGIDGRSIQ